MSEIVFKIAEYVKDAESDIELHTVTQYWIGRLGELYDALWALCIIGAISERTFLDTTQPIVDFEHDHNVYIICRFNKPVSSS